MKLFNPFIKLLAANVIRKLPLEVVVYELDVYLDNDFPEVNAENDCYCRMFLKRLKKLDAEKYKHYHQTYGK